ncbi:hypothetical protein EG329_009111 [Mollisiaceae sp. DMI_Dod_QoI]|nr:hypothetical protein EG329_009111 [Helotiales sp. DMI_Dod_QoI]
MGTSAEKKLQLALDSFPASAALIRSPFRKFPQRVLKLLLEQLLRNRKVPFHQKPLRDGTYITDVLLQVSKICKAFKRLIGAWLETKYLKWGGPLCGFFDLSETIFVLDLNMLDAKVIRTKLGRLDEELEVTKIKSWACLGWSPLNWWFKRVFFPRFGIVDWDRIRRFWNEPAFQIHAKHIRIDMGGLELESPILLLDAVLSFLGRMENIDTLDIKVRALLPEPWPQREAVEKGQIYIPNHPVVPLWGIIWKWQKICNPWDASQHAVLTACSCCRKRRLRLRYWDVLEKPGGLESWVELKPSDDNACFDYRAIGWTCDERKHWARKRKEVKDKSSWYNFYDTRLSSTKIEDVALLFGNFLEDIEAFAVDVSNKASKVGIQDEYQDGEVEGSKG